MKRILLILLSINLFAFAFGQSITVKGKISSTDGELLPGVNVKVKDATIGTITDFDGNYQLKVNKGEETCDKSRKSTRLEYRANPGLN